MAKSGAFFRSLRESYVTRPFSESTVVNVDTQPLLTKEDETPPVIGRDYEN